MKRRQIEQEMLAQPVRSLQYMLGRLAQEYWFLPQLAADGIFGEKTLEAVMLFQRELHPPVTGIVDRGTWEAIWSHWKEMEERLEEPRALRGFPGEGSRVKPGEEVEFMILPQTMFQMLAQHLNGIVPGTADGTHGLVSANNVRWLQRAGGVEETGIMDGKAWGLLSRLYELFVVQDLEQARKPVENPSPFTGGWG